MLSGACIDVSPVHDLMASEYSISNNGSCRRFVASQTAIVSAVDASGEPFGGELALDLRTLQVDVGNHGARWRPGELEHSLVELGVCEFLLPPELEVAANIPLVHVELRGDATNRELGTARLGRTM